MEHFVGPTFATGIGLLIAFAGACLVLRLLPPNRRLGICTRRTMADPAAWYIAHRALGWVVLAMGLLVAALSMWPTYPVHPAFPLVCVLVSGAAGALVYWRYAV